MGVLKNARHERFAQAIATGKTVTEAYVIAGYKDNDGNASKMAAKPEITGRVKEITGKGAELAQVTVASIIVELEEARALAAELDMPAPMIAASLGKAKVANLNPDRVELTGKDGGPIETVVSDFDLARWIAHKLEAGVQPGTAEPPIPTETAH